MDQVPEGNRKDSAYGTGPHEWFRAALGKQEAALAGDASGDSSKRGV